MRSCHITVASYQISTVKLHCCSGIAGKKGRIFILFYRLFRGSRWIAADETENRRRIIVIALFKKKNQLSCKSIKVNESRDSLVKKLFFYLEYRTNKKPTYTYVHSLSLHNTVPIYMSTIVASKTQICILHHKKLNQLIYNQFAATMEVELYKIYFFMEPNRKIALWLAFDFFKSKRRVESLTKHTLAGGMPGFDLIIMSHTIMIWHGIPTLFLLDMKIHKERLA